MLSLKQLMTLLCVVLGGILASMYWNFWLFIGFIPGVALLYRYSIKAGFSQHELLEAAKEGGNSVKAVAYILLLVSIFIPCWMAAGVITYMIHIGLELIEPAYFLTSAFLITAGTALVLGTSTGSLSAIGVPLMGVGFLLDVPPEVTAGAVVSGAFVGDRTAPLSSANQLVAAFTKLTMHKQMKVLVPTSILSLIATAGFFSWFDLQGHWINVSQQISQESLASAWSYFGNWLMFPLLLLLGSIFCRLRTTTCFWLAIGSGFLLGSVYQHITLTQWVSYLLYGYQSSEGVLVLQGKGVLYMIPLIVFILLTGAFNGILDRTGLIQPYLARILGNDKRLSICTFRMGMFGFILNGICCNQTMPIMITAGSLRSIWIRRFSANDLARVVSDTSLVLSGLIPWNLFAIVCSTIIGVPVLTYAGYAAFLWIVPIITLFWSCLVQRGGWDKAILTRSHSS